MKKLYTLAIATLLTSLSWGQQAVYVAQNCSAVNGGSTDISGQVHYVNNVTPEANPGTLVVVNFYFKNLSQSNMVLGIKRLRLDVPAEWHDGLCWGNVCQVEPGFEGGCYTSVQMTTNPWTSPTVTVEPDSLAELKSDVSVVDVEGGGHYRYYFMEGNTAIDSVDLHVNSTASIDEQPEVGMSLFPNPVNSQLTINTVGLSGNYTVRISDVLGKVVYTDEAGPVKKIDTDDFKNGVYLVSVLEKGNVIQTRRVVVKH